MSRVIKFRVWNGSEMIYDVVAGKFGVFYVNPEDRGDGLHPMDSSSLTPFTTKFSDGTPVMQFTGLHDKNGKEIYEGDIILEGITRKIIVWENGAFHVRVPNYEPRRDLPTRPLCFDMWSPDGIRFEIIGNIYQNPELTKA